MTKIIQQLNQQRDKKNDLRKLISLYVREGLVARFSQSDLGQKYILKGASVFQILAGAAHRTTKDIDFLGYGPSDEASLAKEFGEIINIKIDDGLEFNAIATSVLLGLTPKYVTYDSKREKLWKNLYSEGQMGHRPKLREAIAEISGFIMPVARAAAENRPFHQSWQPQTGWQQTPVNFKDYEGRMQEIFPLPEFQQNKSSQAKNTELE